jgi:Asp-tRNA(Asn)/Glu-tRNA(Gln) amidotransferase A subunit family amidase
VTPLTEGAVACAAAVAAGEVSPVELTKACLRQIEVLDPVVGAWEHVDPERALVEARECQPGPLQGVPFGVKDVFNSRHLPTTMGSEAWAGFTPGNDARAVFNARRAGGSVLGKTVTAEFGVHEPGRTRNPHDLDRSTGTSSSGSAAAVAAGMVPWAFGTQTAGSIVRPASYCGVYGYKPSYGAIPRTGVLKTTDTLDTVGVLCRSPRDLRPLLEALRVHGGNYPFVQRSLDAASAPVRLERPRIALLADGLGPMLWNSVAADARAALAGAAERLAAAGAEIVPVVMPPALLHAHAVHATIYERALAYYFSIESGQPETLSASFRAMIDRGRSVSLADYTATLDHQEALRRVFDSWVARFDAVITLSTVGSAPAWGADDPDDSALIWTLCGAPSLSIPALTCSDGLPLGLQLVGRRWHDHALLDVVDWLAVRGMAPTVPIVGIDASALVNH